LFCICPFIKRVSQHEPFRSALSLFNPERKKGFEVRENEDIRKIGAVRSTRGWWSRLQGAVYSTKSDLWMKRVSIEPNIMFNKYK